MNALFVGVSLSWFGCSQIEELQLIAETSKETLKVEGNGCACCWGVFSCCGCVQLQLSGQVEENERLRVGTNG